MTSADDGQRMEPRTGGLWDNFTVSDEVIAELFTLVLVCDTDIMVCSDAQSCITNILRVTGVKFRLMLDSISQPRFLEIMFVCD